MFEDVADWEVFARRGREVEVVGVYRQSYPADAVVLLAAEVRVKYAVDAGSWAEWSFFCISRNHPRGASGTDSDVLQAPSSTR